MRFHWALPSAHSTICTLGIKAINRPAHGFYRVAHLRPCPSSSSNYLSKLLFPYLRNSVQGELNDTQK